MRQFTFSKSLLAGVLATLALVVAVGAAPLPDPVKDTPKQPAGGKEVDGLQLTLSAETTKTVQKDNTVPANPREFPGGGAEPIKLVMTLTNVSQKAIKLNTFQVDRAMLRLEVTD